MKIDLNIPLSIVSFLFAVVTSEAQLANGGFETSDFSGWNIFNDMNGTTGPTSVGLFDTAGTGTNSLCAQFQVGSTIVVISGLGYGGGINQSLNLAAGQLTVFLNIAAYCPGSLGNADAGTFVLVLDSKPVLTNRFGAIGAFQTVRSTINYSTTVTAGAHQIAVDMRRGWFANSNPNVGSLSPYQYLDNVTLSGSSVPPRLNIQGTGASVILTWTNPAFALQAAPSLTGVYANIPDATSPYTNAITEPQKYFRAFK